MPPVPDSYLKIASVSRIFFAASSGGDYEALRDVSLSIQKGEFISIIGHSGCGKSTLLNIIAGLDQPTSGHVSVEGQIVRAPGPERGIVFQNHSLLPWLTVLQNVELAIQMVSPGLPRAEVTSRASAQLEQVGLSAHLHKRPSEISGGMKQRVGIARAFAIEPKVLLLDEPFGALDALTRARMQDDLLAIWEAQRKTVVMITHDVDEAIYLSDRIVLMTNGPAARIGEIVNVDIPRPRSRETLIDLPEYDAIRKHLLHYLASHHRVPMTEAAGVQS
ncbi:MAG TPA: ABC transporter ATP-binding protein [Planctomycetota bacterium]|nr:ABC transporter ATP-binding protein [Planctomycetota bacterium]